MWLAAADVLYGAESSDGCCSQNGNAKQRFCLKKQQRAGKSEFCARKGEQLREVSGA